MRVWKVTEGVCSLKTFFMYFHENEPYFKGVFDENLNFNMSIITVIKDENVLVMMMGKSSFSTP